MCFRKSSGSITVDLSGDSVPLTLNLKIGAGELLHKKKILLDVVVHDPDQIYMPYNENLRKENQHDNY